MPFVVMCGPAHTAPDKIVGPFDSRDEADRWAEQQLGQPERYADVRELVPPPD